MPDLSYDPPLPPGNIQGFVQTIRLIEAGKPIAHARWHIPGDGGDGIAQLLDLYVAEPHRRRHHGLRMLEAVQGQLRKFWRSRQIKPRKLWVNVEQKDHVAGRALLTYAGFHHVATIPSLLKKQDAMVYMVSMD